VDQGQGHYEPRAVSIGERVPGGYRVRRGLVAGERVVVSANFLIDSESRIGAIGAAPAGSAGQPAQSLSKPTPGGPPQ